MGLIQSIICGVVLCFERVVSWTCCALVIMTLMTLIILLTVYGISLGYHYAQKEIARFATKDTEDSKTLRSGMEGVNEPVVRLVAVNKSQEEQVTDVISGQIYQTKEITQAVYLEQPVTPIIVLETERPSQEIELTPHERELARKLIGRFRRARRNISTSIKVLSSHGYDKNTTPPKSTLIAL